MLILSHIFLNAPIWKMMIARGFLQASSNNFYVLTVNIFSKCHMNWTTELWYCMLTNRPDLPYCRFCARNKMLTVAIVLELFLVRDWSLGGNLIFHKLDVCPLSHVVFQEHLGVYAQRTFFLFWIANSQIFARMQASPASLDLFCLSQLTFPSRKL